ncbi:hypothetical protein E3P99_01250 [Wallemia hederae]|uniref:Thiaminase-2/PQQC domain-containing protein n=1 Tax=Wallemia hederae TaxID=1540922 RepID=A0A4T0FRD7_9BASI|nr:hypothetical protein E3P99_01250 [Wallemia hederae]
MVSTQTLIENNKDLYIQATQHPFLAQLGKAQIDPKALQSFLNQDRVFALGYCKWLAMIAARIPLLEQSSKPNTHDVDSLHLMSFAISNGLREVNMFPNTLASLNLEYRAVEANAACFDYVQYLYQLDNNDDAIVALWALEKVYLDGWGYAKSLDTSRSSPYSELLDNWTCEQFVHFVDTDLKAQVERIQSTDTRRFDDIFASICRLEIAFWEQSLLLQ